jgi:hypothetical protein
MFQRNVNPNIRTGFTRRATALVKVTCQQTHVYCRREFPLFAINETSSDCRIASLEANLTDVPAGLPPQSAEVELTDLPPTMAISSCLFG